MTSSVYIVTVAEELKDYYSGAVSSVSTHTSDGNVNWLKKDRKK